MTKDNKKFVMACMKKYSPEAYKKPCIRTEEVDKDLCRLVLLASTVTAAKSLPIHRISFGGISAFAYSATTMYSYGIILTEENL